MALNFGTNVFDPSGTKNASEFFDREAEDKLRTRIVIKASDETVVSSTTIQDDDELFIGVDSKSKYSFEVNIDLTSSSVPDFKWKFSSPAGTVGSYVVSGARFGGGQGGLQVGNIDVELNLAILDTGSTVLISGIIETGNTSGTLTFQWAQDTSSAVDTIVKANSFMVVTKI